MGGDKDKKGKILIIIGALLVVVALSADAIGIGVKPGFGWKQGLILIAGLAIAWMGKKGCKCSSGKSSDSPKEKEQPPESSQV